MTIATNPVADISVFDRLRSGEPGPHWLSAGVVFAWDLPPERSEVTLISVSENANFLVSVDDRPVGVVRLSRPGYLPDPGCLDSEMDWVAAISRDAGVGVPRHLPARDGRRRVDIADQDGAVWHCVMTEFVHGAVLETLDDPAVHLHALGRVSARLHAHARAWVPPQGFRRFDWDLPDMVGPAARWGDWEAAALDGGQRSLLRAARDRALDVLSVVPRTRSTWGLIHADLRPSNVISDGDALTVIDFDDSGFGWYLFDFAASLSFVEHEPYAGAMARNWVAGYTELIPLSEGELEVACAFSMIRRLQMLGWTVSHRADALPGDLHSQSIPGSCTVAQRYLADPLWLLTEGDR